MVLCRRTGRQRHLVPIVGVSSVCCAICTLCCWYVAWTWVFSVAPRSLPLIGRLTSNCSTERHFTVPHEAVISGLAPESTCYACKVRSVYFADEARKLLHHLGTVLASCLSATVLGLSKKPLGCGACGMIGIGNWALRTVCKWSKSFMCGGAYGRRSSGFWCRVHLEFAYVAGCSLLVRHQGSHAWQSRAETFMVVGLVLASRSA